MQKRLYRSTTLGLDSEARELLVLLTCIAGHWQSHPGQFEGTTSTVRT